MIAAMPGARVAMSDRHRSSSSSMFVRRRATSASLVVVVVAAVGSRRRLRGDASGVDDDNDDGGPCCRLPSRVRSIYRVSHRFRRLSVKTQLHTVNNQRKRTQNHQTFANRPRCLESTDDESFVTPKLSFTV